MRLNQFRVGVLGIGSFGLALVGLVDLAVQFAPLLFGPPQLLDRGCQIQEVDRDDGCPGAEVGVADQCVEFPPGLY